MIYQPVTIGSRVKNKTISHKVSRVFFQINSETLPLSDALLYLRRKIAYNNSNCPAVLLNLNKERRWWGMILRVLMKTGAIVWVRGMMYKAVAQAVLLYGRKRWVVTGAMFKFLGWFHHSAAIRITGMTGKNVADGEWEYPLVAAALEAAGLHPIQEYIWIWQATIAAQVECHPIYELCTKAERRPGTSWVMRWWNKDVVHDSEE